MQQGGELGMGGLAGRGVHPREVASAGSAAGPCPSLGPSHFLQRLHWYNATMRQSNSRPQLGRRAVLPRSIEAPQSDQKWTRSFAGEIAWVAHCLNALSSAASGLARQSSE